ncbi:NAD-P-binding protein [Flagelloscypha sp. PMI_526]|nr:NAD-P-binding protein [Flagelloscypha sp. PMI_526]
MSSTTSTSVSASSEPQKPKLCGILSTTNAPSKWYADFTKKHCQDVGVEFELKLCGAGRKWNHAPPGEGVEEAIIEANGNESIDGIMVYFPIFGGQQIVLPVKDVEGLHFKYAFNLYHNIRFIQPSTLLTPNVSSLKEQHVTENQPDGMVKSILPCTPLAVVKVLEYTGTYNMLLSYGDRAWGKVITVLLVDPWLPSWQTDGARVFSVDINNIQEYTKRPAEATQGKQYHPHHIVSPTTLSLEECLGMSDVVVSAVPAKEYKIKTNALKSGVICINVSAEKNFEINVREKASLYLPAVGKVTNMMLLRNLLRLQESREMIAKA